MATWWVWPLRRGPGQLESAADAPENELLDSLAIHLACVNVPFRVNRLFPDLRSADPALTSRITSIRVWNP
jgi:hypothetical protein